MKKEFILFSLIGCVGFVVDASVFQLFFWLIDNHYVARLISYIFAATATWALNRTYTFTAGKQNKGIRGLIVEWSKFLCSQTLGFSVNYGTFFILVTFTSIFTSLFKEIPVLAIAAGSIAGLAVNFIVAKYVIFKHSAK